MARYSQNIARSSVCAERPTRRAYLRVLGEELAQPLGLRRAEHLAGGPSSSITPLMQEDDAVGDLAREAHLVGHHDHRRAVRGELAHHAPAPRRSARGRARRSARRTASPSAASPAPARSRRAAAGRPRGAPDIRPPCRSDARGAGTPRRARSLPCAAALRTRIGASMTLPSTVMCGHRLNCWNTMPRSRRIAVDLGERARLALPARVDARSERLAVDEDLAGGRRLEVVDAAQQRALARAAGADHADHAAAMHVERDALQHLERPEALVHVGDADARDIAHEDRGVRFRRRGTRTMDKSASAMNMLRLENFSGKPMNPPPAEIGDSGRRHRHAGAGRRPRRLRSQHREDGGVRARDRRAPAPARQDAQIARDRAAADRARRGRSVLPEGRRGGSAGARRREGRAGQQPGRRRAQAAPAGRARADATIALCFDAAEQVDAASRGRAGLRRRRSARWSRSSRHAALRRRAGQGGGGARAPHRRRAGPEIPRAAGLSRPRAASADASAARPGDRVCRRRRARDARRAEGRRASRARSSPAPAPARLRSRRESGV